MGCNTSSPLEQVVHTVCLKCKTNENPIYLYHNLDVKTDIIKIYYRCSKGHVIYIYVDSESFIKNINDYTSNDINKNLINENNKLKIENNKLKERIVQLEQKNVHLEEGNILLL